MFKMNKSFFLALLFPFVFPLAYGQDNSDLDISKILVDSIPYAFGITAFIISVFSLWKTHLSPFNLVISSEQPSLTLYKLGDKDGKTIFLDEKKYDGKDWGEQQLNALKYEKKFDRVYWIPSIAISISFYNSGKKSGNILNVRSVLTLNRIEKPNKFALYPRGFVDPSKWKDITKSRIKIFDSIKDKWSPIILPPQETKKVNLILEAHAWLEKLTGDWEIQMEVLTSEKDWESFLNLKISLRQFVFDLSSTENYAPDFQNQNEEFDNEFYSEKLVNYVKVIDNNLDSVNNSKIPQEKKSPV